MKFLKLALTNSETNLFWSILSRTPSQAKRGRLHIELNLKDDEPGYRQGLC